LRRAGCGFLLILLSCCIVGCSARATTPPAKIYKETGLAKPGQYRLQFLLNGRDTLPEYLSNELKKNPLLQEFDISQLMKLFQKAYPQLYLPVQPEAPLCNLETNFKHCKGIELSVDFESYEDDTIILYSWMFYHVNLRLEGGQPNFFRAVKSQRDRGEFALPRRYYVGSLIEALRKALPILQEIETGYRKYIKNDDQEIEIELTLEESRVESMARQSDRSMKDVAEIGGSALLSVLPNVSSITGLTISALHSGGRTFWEVLREEKEFELYKRRLDLDQVEFSYADSIANNFHSIFTRSGDSPSDIIIREIRVRLRQKEHTLLPQYRSGLR
jgi:hypothetical protein